MSFLYTTSGVGEELKGRSWGRRRRRNALIINSTLINVSSKRTVRVEWDNIALPLRAFYVKIGGGHCVKSNKRSRKGVVGSCTRLVTDRKK